MTLLRLDAAFWRRQTAGLRRANAGPASRTALFCDLFSMPAAAKMQALYALALRGLGVSSVVLMQAPNPTCERLYRAAGDVRFAYLNDFIDDTMRRAASNEADAVLAGIKSSNDLLSYSRNSVRSGRNVLSRVLRLFRQGHLELNIPEHRSTLSKWLAESIVSGDAVRRLIAELAPDIGIFLERGYTPAGEVFDTCLAMGVDTVQWLGAPQADRLILKRYKMATRDQHPLSLADETWCNLKVSAWPKDNDDAVLRTLRAHYNDGTWYNRQKLQEGKRIQSRESVIESLKLDPAKKTAVIFSHILYDATFFYGESLFQDYEEWLVETVREAVKNPNLNWIVKVHPVNIWRSKMDGVAMEQLEVAALRKALGELPPHVKVLTADTDINTYSLFSLIDYGLTVRGTIGLELPCFGIPVVTAGTGRYSGRGFTIDPRTREEFANVLGRLHEFGRLNEAETRLARQYAYGTFFLRPMPMESFVFDYEAATYGLPELGANVFPANGKTFGSKFGEDISQVAAWIANGESEDFIFEGQQ